MLIKYKKIFEYFNCFWKVFFFIKISKNSKIVQLCFGLSFLWVKPVASLLRSSRDSLASMFPNREKYFKKFWVFGIFATQFSDLVMSGSSSCEFT